MAGNGPETVVTGTGPDYPGNWDTPPPLTPQQQDGLAKWNVFEAVRTQYPGLRSWTDEKILDNLSDPKKFRDAFPQFAHLSDDTIIKNMAQYEPKDAAQRFAESAVAPFVGTAKGLYHAATDAPETPLETGLALTGLLPIERTLIEPSIDQLHEAYEKAQQGKYSEAIGHSIAAAVPVIGPWAAEVGETEGKQLGAGDYAGAAGTAVGNTALALAPKAIEAGAKAVPKAVRAAAGAGPGTVRDLIERTRADNAKAQGVTADNLEKAKQEHAAELLKLKQQYDQDVRDAQATHQEKIRKRNADVLGLKQTYDATVRKAKAEHDAAVKERGANVLKLKQQYDQSVREAKAKYDAAVKEHDAQAEKAQREYDEKVENGRHKMKAQFKKEVQKYTKSKTEAQAARDSAQKKFEADRAAQAKIEPTQQKLRTAWSNLRAGIETARKKSLEIGNTLYNGVNEKLNPLPADNEALAESLDAARDILRGKEVEVAKTGDEKGQLVGNTPLIKKIADRIDKSGMHPLTYADLQGYYSELGNEMVKGTLPGDVYKAYDTLHEAIGEEMQRIANSQNMGKQLKAARAYWKRMKQTFGKTLSVRDAASGALKKSASGLMEEDALENEIRLLGSFDKDIPKLFASIKNIEKGLEALPNPVSPRELTSKLTESLGKNPIPEPPRPVKPAPVTLPIIPDVRGPNLPLPPILPPEVGGPNLQLPPILPPEVGGANLPLPPILPPDPRDIVSGKAKSPVQKKIGPEEIQAAKREGVNKRQKQIDHRVAWAGVGALFYLMEDAMRGKPPSVLGTAASIAAPLASQAVVTKVLSNPKVVDWLTKARPEDVAMIPPDLRGSFPQILTEAQKRGIRISPALAVFGKRFKDFMGDQTGAVGPGAHDLIQSRRKVKYGVFDHDGNLISEPYSDPLKAAKDAKHDVQKNTYVGKIDTQAGPKDPQAVVNAVSKLDTSGRGNYVAIEKLRKANPGITDEDILKAATSGKLVLSRYDGVRVPGIEQTEPSMDLRKYLKDPLNPNVYYIGVAIPRK